MKLENCFEITNGKGINLNASGKFPVYGSTGVVSSTDKFLCDNDNTLVARVGANCGFTQFAKGKYWVTDNTLILKSKSAIVPKYGYYLVSKLNLQQYKIGAAQPLLTIGILNSIEVKIHSLEEQQHIVNTIGSVDDLIEKNKAIIEKLLKIARLKFDLLFPELVEEKNNTGKTINDLVERITTGLNPRQNFKLGLGNNFYVTVKNIENDSLLLNDSCDKVNDEAITIINKRSKIEKDMILFTGIGSIGRTYFINENPVNWNISESVFAFKAKGNISPYFLYMILTSKAFQSYCISNASGSAQKGIRMEYLKKYNIPDIDLNCLEIFNEKISPLIIKSFELRAKNGCLHKIKSNFLNKYFTN